MMGKSFYIISYDIGDNKRLVKIRKFLVDYGKAVQKSVFECWLTDAEVEEVVRWLRGFIKPKEDRVRIYRLCRECVRNVDFSGIDDEFESEPEDEVII